MIQKKLQYVWIYLKNPENIINLIIVAVAIFVGSVGILANNIEQSLQSIFVALGTLAVAQLISGYASFKRDSKEAENVNTIAERLKKVEEIESGLTKLLDMKHCKFFPHIKVTWDQARRMVEKVRPSGYIYDSTSVKNKSSYEDAIKEKSLEKVEIKRLICVNDFHEKCENFIENVDNPNVTIHHLPYSLPFDVLITHDGDTIEALIGFKTAKFDNDYTSALYIFNKEFASEILQIYKNIFLIDAKEHYKEETKKGSISCNICKEISR